MASVPGASRPVAKSSMGLMHCLVLALAAAGAELCIHGWLAGTVTYTHPRASAAGSALSFLFLTWFYLTVMASGRVLAWLSALAVFLAVALQYTLYHHLGQGVSAELLLLAEARCLDESLACIRQYLYAPALAVGGVFAVWVRACAFASPRRASRRTLASALAFGLCLSLVAYANDRGLMRSRLSSPTLEVPECLVDLCLQVRRQWAYRPPARRVPGPPKTAALGLNIVYVVAESLRSDHLGTNGYSRDTTPRLAQRVRQGAVCFTNVISGGDTTTRSFGRLMIEPTFPALRSLAERPTLFGYAKRAGYTTCAVVPTEVEDGPWWYDGSIDKLVLRADQAGDADGHGKRLDANMLPRLRETIASSAGRPLFLFVSTYCAHWPYAERYGYSPDCDTYRPSLQADDPGTFSDRQREKIINSYDNAIRYFDAWVGQVIDMFDGTDTVVIVTADHGQSLGEYGRWGHCSGTGEEAQLQVPLLLIPTSARAAEMAHLDPLRAKAALPVCHGNIFRTVLDLLGYTTADLQFSYPPSLYQVTPEDNRERRALLSSLRDPSVEARYDVFAVMDADGHLVKVEKQPR